MRLTITDKGIKTLRDYRREGKQVTHPILLLSFLEEGSAISEKLKHHIDIPDWDKVVSILEINDLITIDKREFIILNFKEPQI